MMVRVSLRALVVAVIHSAMCATGPVMGVHGLVFRRRKPGFKPCSASENEGDLKGDLQVLNQGLIEQKKSVSIQAQQTVSAKLSGVIEFYWSFVELIQIVTPRYGPFWIFRSDYVDNCHFLCKYFIYGILFIMWCCSSVSMYCFPILAILCLALGFFFIFIDTELGLLFLFGFFVCMIFAEFGVMVRSISVFDEKKNDRHGKILQHGSYCGIAILLCVSGAIYRYRNKLQEKFYALVVYFKLDNFINQIKGCAQG